MDFWFERGKCFDPGWARTRGPRFPKRMLHRYGKFGPQKLFYFLPTSHKIYIHRFAIQNCGKLPCQK